MDINFKALTFKMVACERQKAYKTPNRSQFIICIDDNKEEKYGQSKLGAATSALTDSGLKHVFEKYILRSWHPQLVMLW